MTAARNVVITSANGATARLLIPLLNAKGYRTIGLIRRPTPTDAHETITDWMNATAAKDALGHADCIIHLSGDANAKNKAAYREANYTTTRTVTDSISPEKHQRIIYLSYANAGTDQKNHYLHYKGEAEELIMSKARETVIFRCPVIIDAPGTVSRMDDLFLSKKGKPVPTIGNGRQKMHPVYRGDVVNAIVAALEKGSPGTYELSGPEEITINGFIRLVNRDPAVKMRHIPAWLAIILSRFIPGISPTFVDLMLHHSDSTYSPGTYREFGIIPTSITRLFAADHHSTA
ncbi:MAG TPA: NAD-dependent epimerase/dehydratase family protein [Puia sp.]|nr:NAD-dependent epimerase/dehydratase family protein [Puia sp.]